MKPYTLSNYLVHLSILTVTLLLLAWILFAWLVPTGMPWILPVYLIFVAAITLAGQVILTNKTKAGKASGFNTYYLAFKTVKMIVILIFLAVWMLLHKRSSVPFVVSAFAIYIAYVVFESWALNRMVRNSGT
ncbi:MAG: hypothetical protein PHV14_01890 [Bacteroidales bacterium]|jgi:cobalamin synthase|nr:hypothetical protein [Bacteroidales bacterium]NLO69230.1 hypothetical protein [Bacteroidales bacterium]